MVDGGGERCVGIGTGGWDGRRNRRIARNPEPFDKNDDFAEERQWQMGPGLQTAGFSQDVKGVYILNLRASPLIYAPSHWSEVKPNSIPPGVSENGSRTSGRGNLPPRAAGRMQGATEGALTLELPVGRSRAAMPCCPVKET